MTLRLILDSSDADDTIQNNVLTMVDGVGTNTFQVQNGTEHAEASVLATPLTRSPTWDFDVEDGRSGNFEVFDPPSNIEFNNAPNWTLRDEDLYIKMTGPPNETVRIVLSKSDPLDQLFLADKVTGVTSVTLDTNGEYAANWNIHGGGGEDTDRIEATIYYGTVNEETASTGRLEVLDTAPKPGGRTVRNVYGSDLPIYSALEIVSTDGNGIANVTRPRSDGLQPGVILFTHDEPIPDGELGTAYSAFAIENVDVNVDDTAAVGDMFGTQADSFSLKKDNFGFVVQEVGGTRVLMRPFRGGIKIILIGGRGFMVSQVTGDTNLYTPETDTFASQPNLPASLTCAYALAAYLNYTTYSVGGCGPGPTSYGFSDHHNAFNSGTWTSKTVINWARMSGVNRPINGKNYVAGGQSGPGGGTGDPYTEEYTPSTDTWALKAKYAPPSTDNYHQSGAVYSAILHMMGGRYSQIHRTYDPSTDTWSTAAWVSSDNFESSFTLKGKIWRTHGFNTINIDEYNPSTDSWSTKQIGVSDFMADRHGAATNNIKGYVTARVFGIQIYDATGDSWSSGAGVPQAYPRAIEARGGF
jgi:hypothetical protein